MKTFQLIGSGLESNLWKLLVFHVTQRRYYLSILAIYFLGFPDVSVVQIGLWTAAGYLAEFLFEIPSGYLSDRIGHKKMLVLSKVLLVLAVVCFLWGASFPFFIIGSILTSLSYAANSGTSSAFLHETLVSLGRESDFIAVNTKLGAYAALISVLRVIVVPIAVKLNLLLPFYISLFLDVLGLLAAITLKQPSIVENTAKTKSIVTLLKQSLNTGFLPFTIFTSAIAGFAIAKANYAFTYLEFLGYPVMYLVFIFGFSGLLQFFFEKNIWRFEKILSIKKIFLSDLFVFPLSFALIALLNNPYIVVVVLILINGYELGRRTFVDGYILKNYVDDKRYKATMLSIKGQVTMLINFVMVFVIGFVMDVSYKLGFYIMGLVLFLFLVTVLGYIFRSDKGANVKTFDK